MSKSEEIFEELAARLFIFIFMGLYYLYVGSAKLWLALNGQDIGED